MTRRSWIVVALILAFAAHQDFWFWNDARRVLGLPVGLAYHVGLCLVAALLFWLLVRAAPEDEPELP